MKKISLYSIVTFLICTFVTSCGNPLIIKLTDGMFTFTVSFNSMGGTHVDSIRGLNRGTAINAPANPTSGYGTFAGWYSNSGRTNLYTFGTPITGNITLYASWTPTYNIGDTGPGLGKIFYRSELGFPLYTGSTPGDYSFVTAHYLEAWTSIGMAVYPWQSAGNDIPGTGTVIGMGLKNSNIIDAHSDYTFAATDCVSITRGGMTDWFLPSRDELNELYNQKIPVGIPSDSYWSSSQASISQAWYQDITTGVQAIDFKDSGPGHNISPIRAF